MTDDTKKLAAMRYTGFSVIVQYHDQPPIETQAFRPQMAREFLPGITLSEVWDWVKERGEGRLVESVTIRVLDRQYD